MALEQLAPPPAAIASVTFAAVLSRGLRTEPGGSFALTDDGRFLCVGHPSASREMVLLLGSPTMYGGFGEIIASLRTGRSGPEIFTGEPVAEARQSLSTSAVGNRCSYSEGSFFDGVPTGGDAYILSHILHDWPDDKCLTLLHHCQEALKPDGRILVVETVLPDGDEPQPVKVQDLGMAIGLGGSERTEAEYAALFTEAGLRLACITPTSSIASVLEARLGGES